ncbi:MAG: 4Fe-4S dicluster domain-containing protein [Ilumatobacter sp.]|nr:4Fe-4S dicluster domain-containing protein [Ilumatobacter sp.]
MTTLVMCTDHGAHDPIAPAGTNVQRAAGLCDQPGQLRTLVPAEETSLLLALHGSDYHRGRVQAAVRRLGFDPLGVGILDLDRIDDESAVTVAAAALVARTEAFPGSRPEQVKLDRPPTRRTRRALFSLGVPTYAGAPMIDADQCVAGDGCRACVRACPVDALTWSGGTVSYDKTACLACGVCVTTCPTGAVANPVASPAAVEAEIRAAIDVATGPIGIRYVCAPARATSLPGWHDVVVPCTSMVTVGWLLAPLVLGACAVDTTPCAVGGCDRGRVDLTDDLLDDAGAVLHAVGIEPARIGGLGHEPLGVTSPPVGLFEAGCTQRVIAALHDSSATAPGFVDLAEADVGAVGIDSATCTACEMCASCCPTDALRSSNERGAVVIDFDSRRCVACGQCVLACPEIDRDAIRLDRGFDPVMWAAGRQELRRAATASCEVCGRPVAPDAMLRRIGSLLGEQHADTLDLVARRCIDCRGR